MDIYNGTAHMVTIYDKQDTYFSNSLRKIFLINDLAEPLFVIPPSRSLSVRFDTELSWLDGVPVKERRIVSIDPLPDGYDLVIVSMLYARDTTYNSRIATVVDPVFNSKNKVVGCLNLNTVVQNNEMEV